MVVTSQVLATVVKLLQESEVRRHLVTANNHDITSNHATMNHPTPPQALSLFHVQQHIAEKSTFVLARLVERSEHSQKHACALGAVGDQAD